MNIINDTSLFYSQPIKTLVKPDTANFKKENDCNKDIFFCQNKNTFNIFIKTEFNTRFNNKLIEFNKILREKTHTDDIREFIEIEIAMLKEAHFKTEKINCFRESLAKFIKTGQVDAEQIKSKQPEVKQAENKLKIYDAETRAFGIRAYGEVLISGNDQKFLLDILNDPNESKNTPVIVSTINVLGENFSKKVQTRSKIVHIVPNTEVRDEIKKFENHKNIEISEAAKNALKQFYFEKEPVVKKETKPKKPIQPPMSGRDHKNYVNGLMSGVQDIKRSLKLE